MKYQRVKDLFTTSVFESFKDVKILLLGVGGVGSFCLDCLYRTGITDITIVDFDTYEQSNQNRQIGSSKTGAIKVDRLKELYPNITTINKRVTKEWVDDFDFKPYTMIVDAIDDIKPKIALIQKEYKKLIISAGSAKKSDPTKIEVVSIWKTYNDPFAKKIREELKKVSFNKNVKTVFSTQPIITKEKGSFVGVTGSFGLVLCAEVIKNINVKLHCN